VRACLTAGMTRQRAEQETGLTCSQLHYCRSRYLPELPPFALPEHDKKSRHLSAITVMRADGLSLSQIAHRLGLSVAGVKNVCRRYKIKGARAGEGARWSVARQRRMAALSSQGMSAKRIAAYLGESVDAVASAMRRFGLFANPQRQRVDE